MNFYNFLVLQEVLCDEREHGVCPLDKRIGLFKEVTQRLNGLSGLLLDV